MLMYKLDKVNVEMLSSPPECKEAVCARLEPHWKVINDCLVAVEKKAVLPFVQNPKLFCRYTRPTDSYDSFDKWYIHYFASVPCVTKALFVAFNTTNDEVAGISLVMTAGDYGSKCAFILSHYVKPSWRGVGIGRKLCEAATKGMHDVFGTEMIQCRTTPPPSNVNREFWKRVGFEAESVILTKRCK
jgi:GNAT superfamily N-acetyltransferase